MNKYLPLTLAACTLALAACNAPQDNQDFQTAPSATPVAAKVTAENAWCRPTPNAAKVAGCYVTLTAATDDVLTAFTTEWADMPQIHEMKHEDGMMKMAELKSGLPLPAGQTVELKPGGNHFMLMGLKSPLVEGDKVTLNLEFAMASPITVEAEVRTPPVVDSEE